ncbi:hypothetical protein NW759_009250 [Fusarium solani]|nr:hypothetical protein NW759_009250 [Fusarium solani]
MGLTIAQAIGIGVAVGFVKQPSPNPRVLTAPRDPASWRNPITNSHRTLPDRVDDFTTLHEIRQGVGFEYDLRIFVENFIDSRHREQPRVSPSIFNEDELVRLAGEPANGGTWSETIFNVATRGAAVRCFLAQHIFKRMHPSCPVQESLIAPEISSCYQLVCRIYQNPCRENIIGIWRECVYLLQACPWQLDHLPSWRFGEDDPRKERTWAMVPGIVNSLRLESLRNDLNIEKGSLEVFIGQTLERAANSAMTLLGQPSEWEAVWTSPEPGFIVFPEMRFTWNGKTKYSKPAEVDVNVPKPVPSDSPNTETGEQHSSDVGCQSDAVADEQPNHGTVDEQPNHAAAQALPHDTIQLSGAGNTD